MTITDSTRPPEALTDPGDLINFDVTAHRGGTRPARAGPRVRRRADPPEHRRLVRAGRLPAARSSRRWPSSACSACTCRATDAPAVSAVEYGLAGAELEAGDSGLRTFVSRAGFAGDVRDPQARLRGAEDRSGCRRWPRGEAIGCFGLTEPDRGLRPVGGMTDLRPPRRRRLGDQRHQAVDRAGDRRAGRRHLGTDRRRHARVPGADRDPGFHGHPDRAEAVDARIDPVRHRPRRRPAARRRACSRTRRGCEGRSPASTRRGTGSSGAPWARPATATRPPCAYALRATAVRQAARRLPAHPAEARRHGAGDQQGLPARAAPRPAEGRRNAAARTRSRSAS